MPCKLSLMHLLEIRRGHWYKAHLVAPGFTQQPGLDFHSTFNPVVKTTTDLGALHYFLGVEDNTGVPTPMCSITVFSALKSDSSVDISKYQQLIGMLQYLSFTRPDIAFTINKLAQFMHCPNQYHWKVVKRLFRYLNRIFSYGIQVPKEQDSRLVAYSGSDWEGEPIDRTSTTGYVVYLGSKPISWSFKKQRSFSRSSTEVEYHVVATTAAKINWLVNL
ncbi:hypothetical protein KY284_026594 [Solanum tuberosum]|nr:hypothetical protein KY284_026594 [Solanum tuberosum]